MKYYKLILILSLFTTATVFSQEKLIKHTVRKGETITAIAKKYKIEPTAIYELNPDCRRGLKLASILLIPNQNTKSINAKSEPKSAIVEKTHEVKSKETWFGIAKQYEIALKDLNNANPELAGTSLKAGQTINIPTKLESTTTVVVKKEEAKTPLNKEVLQKEDQPVKSVLIADKPQVTATTIHEVMPMETKFGIAKQFGIAIADLDKANPILEKEALKVGQKILIPVKTEVVNLATKINKTESTPLQVIEKEKPKPESIASIKETNPEVALQNSIHEVLPKETKYGISKKYGITVEELEKQNPAIAKNLFVGAKLTISRTKLNQSATEDTIEVLADNKKDEVDDNLSIASSIAKWDTREELADELVRMASSNLGSRYRSGGTSKNGFDCSGLICSTFSPFDINLPRSSIEMASFGSVINANDAKKGDLIFFKTNGRNQINHVGMVVEVCDGEIKFIHSATHSGVIISSTKEKYYEKSFSQINRVLQQ